MKYNNDQKNIDNPWYISRTATYDYNYVQSQFWDLRMFVIKKNRQKNYIIPQSSMVEEELPPLCGEESPY